MRRHSARPSNEGTVKSTAYKGTLSEDSDNQGVNIGIETEIMSKKKKKWHQPGGVVLEWIGRHTASKTPTAPHEMSEAFSIAQGDMQFELQFQHL